MFLFPIGIASMLSSVGLFLYIRNRGGTEATLDVFGKALSGSLIYALALLLLVAGLLLVTSAAVKTIRRVAIVIALAAVLGGGGVATLVPKSVESYQRENNCVIFDGSCVDPNRVVRPLQDLDSDQ